MIVAAAVLRLSAAGQSPVEGNVAGRQSLDSLLIAVGERDQAVRQLAQLTSGDIDTLAVVEYNLRMIDADSENQTIVADILDNGGWPEGLSGRAVESIFLVIQHADLDYQKKYFDLMREQAERGVLKMSDFVTFNDRVLMYEGKFQTHGTQTKSIVRDGVNYVYLWPVEDPDGLDARRAELGMHPIAFHLEIMKSYFTTVLDIQADVIWDKTLTPAQLLEMSEASE